MKLSKDQIKKVLKGFSGLKVSPDEFKKHWNKFLALLNVKHHDLVQSIVDALSSAGDDLGLSQEELVDVANKIGIQSIRNLVFKKLSPNLKEKHPELSEEVGTSFTSTANVARYPVPLGSMLRRRGFNPKKKKKK